MLPVRTSFSNEDDGGWSRSILVSQPSQVSRISSVRREGRRRRLGSARSLPKRGCGGTSKSLVTMGTLYGTSQGSTCMAERVMRERTRWAREGREAARATTRRSELFGMS